MNKIIILTLTFLLSILISEDFHNFAFIKKQNNNYHLEFLQDDIKIENSNDYNIIKTDPKIGSTNIIGMPKLPSYSSLIMIDPTKDYQLEYIVKESYFIDNVKMIPNQQIVNGLERNQIDDIDLEF